VNPLGLLSGGWLYLAAFVAGGAVAGGATYYVVHNADAVTITNLKLQRAQEQQASTAASLTQLNKFIANMNGAALDFQTAQQDIDTRFAALQRGLHNAYTHPLPGNCKPDNGRVQSLASAIAATNAHPAH
jgi:hypothetical protein